MIELLKNAIQQNDWQLAYKYLEAVLVRIIIGKPILGARFAYKYYLDSFLRMYPNAQWAKVFLETILDNSYVQGREPPEILIATNEDYPLAGASNFLASLENLYYALVVTEDESKKAFFVASSILDIIMANLIELAFTNKQEDFQKMMNADVDPNTGIYINQEAALIGVKFLNTDQVAKLRTELWLNLITLLEESLSSNQS